MNFRSADICRIPDTYSGRSFGPFILYQIKQPASSFELFYQLEGERIISFYLYQINVIIFFNKYNFMMHKFCDGKYIFLCHLYLLKILYQMPCFWKFDRHKAGNISNEYLTLTSFTSDKCPPSSHHVSEVNWLESRFNRIFPLLLILKSKRRDYICTIIINIQEC